MKQRIFASRSDSETPREKENRLIAYEAACEGIVLLKNDGALPLAPCRIALFGAGVSRTIKGGTGSGEVNERYSVSILEGMKKAGFEVATERWIDEFEKEREFKFNEWSNAKRKINDIISDSANSFMEPYGPEISNIDIENASCDTAIYVVSRQAGEGEDKKLDKGEFDLSAVEIKNITTIAQCFRKSILVINSGSYMNIGDLDDKVSAVLYFCQQGMEGGNAFADVISGKVNPSGKLTDTWAKSYSDVPFGEEYSYLGNVLEQCYKEGIYVGYRFYDAFGVRPRYAFGHGLSYTSFDIKCEDVSFGRAEFTVTNTGRVSGKETVMLFARVDCLRLVGFKKTKMLESGESQKISISFTARDLAVYNTEKASYVLPAGDIVLLCGGEQIAVIRNDREQTVSKLTNITSAGIEEIAAPFKKWTAETDRVITAPVIECKEVSYGPVKQYHDDKVDEILSKLSKKELAEVCVGEGLSGMFLKSSGNFTPGAVGRTTSNLYGKGIVNVNLSDGPAGLRLLRICALTKNGSLRYIKDNYPISAVKLLPKWVKGIVRAPRNAQTLYQFTTAFPVETALAQTWNEELCEKVGSAISREMTEYGITYFLGPAVNIHRNPLCGRNYEYMSEDPFLSGKMAAAIIRGIQSIDGNYATVKHFACNNSEDQRNHMSSNVNEKTLREIYLRAFEICVKEGGVKAVMTSYNKLNGTYTPESHDLCTTVLRNEWGFDGVVMTDWFSTGKGLADPAKAAMAGNDMFMPGMKSDKTRLLKSVPESTLRCNAANIIRQIINSGVNL